VENITAAIPERQTLELSRVRDSGRIVAPR